ncbi:aggregation-promoting factor [Liquorilactobacillus uvarum]|uniref:aggregation-promoting factor n=1 Tax=Liquorilactobacillus uvarum TaxID=303240 RepID=UPI00288BC6CA|nr:LysM peptidoglycan-binding domain-containing protein [Liquorilactobacillus uvarum]
MTIDASQSVSSTAKVQTVGNKTTSASQTDGQAFRQLLASQNSKNSTTSSTSQSSKQENIMIRWGDTVSELAEKYKTSVAGIVNANQLQDPNLILAGHNLLIPGSSGQATTTTAKATTSSTSSAPNAAAVSVKYANNETSTNKTSTNNESSDEAQARAYIVSRESGGNYNARNGKYIGKYQLDSSYLNGDYSPANQELVANKYVAKRYGSWVNAMQHWKSNNWY